MLGEGGVPVIVRQASRTSFVQSLLLLVGALALLTGVTQAQDEGRVVVLPTTGVVDQVMAGYLREGIARATQEGAQAVIIELDTPGGSLEATRDIVQAQLAAQVPVIVWVGPGGSRAASAGTFLTLAAHVAAMAPATNIGAATPVSADGSDVPEDLGEKVMQDTIASITSIAEERGRPVEWAVSTVKEAASYTVDEALAAGAIDLKADSIQDLLFQVDGRTIELPGGAVTLATATAGVERVEMNPLQAFLHLLSDPNIAFILFTLGFYGLFFELQNPNWVTGILGAFALILAFIGFGNLPLNIAGLLLIGLAVILFVLEFSVTSHGLLTVGGLMAFALGASAFYTEPGDPLAPTVQVAWEIIGLMTLLTGLVIGGIVLVVLRNRRAPQLVPSASHIDAPLVPLGTVAAVRRDLLPAGSVYAAGEEWTARSRDGRPLERGTLVRVVGHDGLTVLVERQPDQGPPGGRQAGGGALLQPGDNTHAERTV
jgi:membrane-bound serine protease (ClpP class)